VVDVVLDVEPVAIRIQIRRRRVAEVISDEVTGEAVELDGPFPDLCPGSRHADESPRENEREYTELHGTGLPIGSYARSGRRDYFRVFEYFSTTFFQRSSHSGA